MSSKFIRVLLLSLTILIAGTSLVLAVTRTVSGTLDEVNEPNGTFTLITEDAEMLELTAPQEVLRRLQTGDLVEVEFEGRMARVIRSVNGPDLDNARSDDENGDSNEAEGQGGGGSSSSDDTP